MTGVSTNTKVSTADAGKLGLRWMTYTGGPSFSSPVTGYDPNIKATIAFVADVSGHVEAIDTANGKIVWSDFFGVPVYSTPTAYDKALWIGTTVSGHVYKVNSLTGAIECSISLHTGELLADPTVGTPPGGKPTVYFGVQDNGVISGPIMAINESTCATDWSAVPYATESGSWSPTAFAVDGKGKPLVLAGSGNPDSSEYALDANTGKLVWKNRNLSPAVNDVGAGLTVSVPGNNGFKDGMGYYPGQDQRLYAINLTTGKTVWTFNYGRATVKTGFKGGRSAAALTGRTLIFGTGAGLMAVNAVTGKEIWDSAKTAGTRVDSVGSPTVTGPPGERVVIYGDMKGVVRVLSVGTGKLLWSFRTPGFIMASPADSNGQILITASDGFVYDFAIGGTHSTTYPTTTATRPANGSTVANPNSVTSSSAAVRVSGRGKAEHPDPKVLVAIEQNGPDGQWWNASSGKWQDGLMWNAASVKPSGRSTAWSLRAPVGRAGAVWQVFARTEDSDGLVDLSAAESTLTISPVASGPRLHLSASSVGPGGSVRVSGTGFRPGGKVHLALGTISGRATASSTGSFPATRLSLPTTFPYGLSAVIATVKSSGRSASAAVRVTSPWTQLGAAPDRTGYLPNDGVFSAELVPDKIYRMQPTVVYGAGSALDSSPVVADDVAYFGTGRGEVDAVNTDMGTLLWQAHAGTEPLKSSPAIDLAKNLLVIGAPNGTVYAFNLHSGALVWKTPTGGAIDSSPTIVDGVVYVGSAAGTLEALDESTGHVRWTGKIGSPGLSSPAVDPSTGLVVIGSGNGVVSAFSTRGSARRRAPAWTHQTGGAVDGLPIISAKTVFVGSAAGKELALSRTSGKLKWSTPIGGSPSTTSALNGNSLYVGSSNGNIYDIRSTNGTVLWDNRTGSAVVGVSTTHGLVFVESADGGLTGYRLGSEKVWIDTAGRSLSTTPAISDNAVIVAAGDHSLYVYTPYGLPMT